MKPPPQLLNRVLAESEFESETFADQNWSGAELRDKTFTRCVFRNLTAPEAIFPGTLFEDCRFEASDLTMIKVKDATFRDVEFERCKLMGIDWSGVRGLTFSVSFKSCVVSY